MDSVDLIAETELNVLEGRARIYEAAIVGINHLLRYTCRILGIK